MARYAGKVSVTQAGFRTIVEWDRPPVNVFTSRLLRELARALRSPAVNSAKVVVVRGSGRCFSAGLDVEEHLRPAMAAMLESFDAALQALWEVPVPVIAQIHGSCIGGGLELVAACDLAVADEGTTFGQPEIRLGVFPPLAAVFYPGAFGPKPAAELLFTGQNMDAGTALQAGIINRVARNGEVTQAVDGLAASIEQHRRESLVQTKRAMRGSMKSPFDGLPAAERIYLNELMTSPEAEEGLRAFLEKRAPRWTEERPLATETSGASPR